MVERSIRGRLFLAGLVVGLGLATYAVRTGGAHEPAIAPESTTPAAAVTERGPVLWSPDSDVTPLESSVLDASEAERLAAPVGLLTGKVLRLADDSPLAGWWISILSTDLEEVQLGAGGEFRFEGVPTGAAELRVRKERKWAGYPGLIDREDRDGQAILTLPAKPYDDPLELRADTGWRVEGRVVSAAGGVPTGTWVEWCLAYPPERVEVDGSGSFVLHDVVPERDETTVSLRIGAPMHATLTSTLELPESTRRLSGFEFLLPADAGALEGRVVDREGRAVPIQFVTLIPETPQGLSERELIVSPEPVLEAFGEDFLAPRGTPLSQDPDVRAYALRPDHFRFDAVPAGRYRVDVTPMDAEFLRIMRDFDSMPGEGPSEEETLAEQRAMLHVVAHGAPVAVEIRSGEVGRVELELPWGAAVEGQVRGPSGAAVYVRELSVSFFQTHAARAGATRETLEAELSELASGGRYVPRGVVVETASGFGIRWEVLAAMTSTDDAGHFLMGQIPPGDVAFHCAPPESSEFAPLRLELELLEGELRQVDAVLSRR